MFMHVYPYRCSCMWRSSIACFPSTTFTLFLRQSLSVNLLLAGVDWLPECSRSTLLCLLPELESQVHTVTPACYKSPGGLDSGVHVSRTNPLVTKLSSQPEICIFIHVHADVPYKKVKRRVASRSTVPLVVKPILFNPTMYVEHLSKKSVYECVCMCVYTSPILYSQDTWSRYCFYLSCGKKNQMHKEVKLSPGMMCHQEPLRCPGGDTRACSLALLLCPNWKTTTPWARQPMILSENLLQCESEMSLTVLIKAWSPA